MYRHINPPSSNLRSINLHLNVHTVEMFEERISRFRNISVLFDGFQTNQDFLPVVDTSSNVFLLVTEEFQASALLKKRSRSCLNKFKSSLTNTYLPWGRFFLEKIQELFSDTCDELQEVPP